MKNHAFAVCFITFSLSAACSTLLAQHTTPVNYDRCSEFFLKNPAEKIYIHTDRDIYSENDTIWFKIYLLNAFTQKPDKAPLRNIYVELVNANNEIKARNMIALQNGVSYGDFDISSYKAGAGRFLLRAYTRYQMNFGDDFLFQKEIFINPVLEKNEEHKHFLDSLTAKSRQVAQPIDLQFLPEGGYLTSGISNTLAFKAVDQRGYGINVSGAICDVYNQIVVTFNSSYLGMGKVVFKPEKGKKYYAVIDGQSEKIELPAATDLVQMSCTHSDTILVVKLRTNTVEVVPAVYHLIVSYRGFVKSYVKVEMNVPLKNIRIPYSELGMGVNQVTLLNGAFVPLSERAVFVDKKEEIVLSVSTDKKAYHKRDSVVVDIHAESKGVASGKALLSVAVTDESYPQQLTNFPDDIRSCLLLTSDIKGRIEEPSRYFEPAGDGQPSVDLLMLTQGWSQYVWNRYLDSVPEIKLQKQFGIEVLGMVSRLFKEEGLKGVNVSMSMKQDNNILFKETVTDSLGYFCFPNLVFPDSIEAAFQCRNKNNTRLNEILPVRTFSDPAPVSAFPEFLIPGEKDTRMFSQLAYKRYIEDKAYHPEKYDIMLDEVIVSKKVDVTNIKDGHFRPYAKADYVYAPTEDEVSYQNVFYYLERKLGSIRYTGESISISGLGSPGNSGSPVLYLDGMEVDQLTLESLPMESIDKVEVLKDPVTLAMFGDNGTFGVIAVYTKEIGQYTSKEHKNGQLSQLLRGYYQSRKFYSPLYSNQDATKFPDRRVTLFWAPMVSTDENGNARLVFFNNDEETTVKVDVQGISADGKPCVGSATYEIGTGK